MCDVDVLKDVSMERGVCRDRQPSPCRTLWRSVRRCPTPGLPSDVRSHHHGLIWAREVFHGEAEKRGGVTFLIIKKTAAGRSSTSRFRFSVTLTWK